MRLYHWLNARNLGGLFCFLMVGAIAACSPPRITQDVIAIEIEADGQTVNPELPAGSTVQQALDQAHLSLGTLDRVEPPAYTLLTDGGKVKVVRVREEFEVEEMVVPFEQLKQPTELLPEGEEQLDPLQKGENGVQEITYRVLYEDGVEVSRAPVKTVIIKPPQPQIKLVGVRPLSIPRPVPGRLAYLYNGSAWLIEGQTTVRRPVVSTGDLDGRVFAISENGRKLLFTRRAEGAEQINTLWVADLSADPVELFDLQVTNIVHFADWVPGSDAKIVFSTVEPRAAAPGWQANNDLYALSFSPSGWVSQWRDKPILEANSGGVYGWWGMNFEWDPSGTRLAYTRPDGFGMLDYNTGVLTPTMEIVPLQTGGDWAWVPGISWGPDGQVLYAVNHQAPEEAQAFDLYGVVLASQTAVKLVPQTGMFAYPSVSPATGDQPDQLDYRLAYLQAAFPLQSETSRYRLVVMDRDGSNARVVFPREGEPGIEPQKVVWSPQAMPDGGGFAIAIIYQGNLWLVEPDSDQRTQITGDGLTIKLDWSPLSTQ